MPTENRRVAAYLPKIIDEQLEAFKVDRGLSGDSPALIAILEEFFGVSQKVAHLSSLEFEELSTEIDDLKTQTSRLQGKLFSELKSSLLSELRSELSGELSSELPVSELSICPPGQLSFLEPEHESPSESVGDIPGESPDKPVSDTSSESEGEPSGRVVEPEYPGDELPSDSEIKPLDGSVTWSGIELSRRLQIGPPQLAAWQHKSTTEFAEWSRQRERELGLEGLSWRRVSRGKYVPTVEAGDDF
jgi:hypothetical protein